MGISPHEALYGKMCRTLVTWDNLVNRIVLGPELLKEMEQEVVKSGRSWKQHRTDRKSMQISIGRT